MVWEGISHIENPCHNFLFHNFVSCSFKSKWLSLSSLISIWSAKIWKGVMQPLAGWPEGLRELGKNFATPPCPALPSWTCTTFNVQLVQLSTRETTWTRLENAAFLYQPHSIIQVSLSVSPFSYDHPFYVSSETIAHDMCEECEVKENIFFVLLQIWRWVVTCCRNFLSPDWDPPAICLISLLKPEIPRKYYLCFLFQMFIGNWFVLKMTK